MDTRTAPRPDDEWSWMDGLFAIWRYRYQIVLATVATGILTAGVMMVIPRSYESVLTLKIGRVLDRPLDEPLQVATLINSPSIGSRLRAAGTTAFKAEVYDDLVAAEVASAPPGMALPPLVTVLGRGTTVPEAKQLALSAAAIVIEEHNRRFDETLAWQRNYRRQLQAQIDAIRTDLADVEAGLRTFRMKPTVEAPAILLMRSQLEEKQSQLLAFERELRDVDISMTANSERTRMLGEPLVPLTRIKPRRTMTTIMATAAAGVLSVCLAVVWDARRRKPTGASGVA